MPTRRSVVQSSSDVLPKEAGGKLVLLNPAGGESYGLDEVGPRTWVPLVEHGHVEKDHRLEAHAWLEHQGQPVEGRRGLSPRGVPLRAVQGQG